MGARLAGLVFAAVATPIVARALGPAAFGNFVLITTVASFVAVGTDAGLPLLMVRRLATIAPSQRSPWARGIWRVRWEISIVAMLLGVGVSLAFVVPPLRWGLVAAFAGLPAMAAISLRTAEHTARLRPAKAGAVELAHRAAVLAGVTLVALLPHSGTTAMIVATSVATWLVAMAFSGPRRTFTLAARPSLGAAWPLAVVPALGVVYGRADLIILAATRDPDEVGAYGLAFRVVEVLLSLAAVGGALLTTIAAADRVDRDRLSQSAFVSLLGPVVVSAAMVAGYRGEIVELLGGGKFAEGHPGEVATSSLFILSLAIALMGVGAVTGALIVAWGSAHELALHFLLIVAINIGLTLVLAPRYGGQGAAVATVASEAVAVVNSLRILRRYAKPRTRSMTWLLPPLLVAAAVLVGANSVDPLGHRVLASAGLGIVAAVLTRWPRQLRLAAATIIDGRPPEEDRDAAARPD